MAPSGCRSFLHHCIPEPLIPLKSVGVRMSTAHPISCFHFCLAQGKPVRVLMGVQNINRDRGVEGSLLSHVCNVTFSLSFSLLAPCLLCGIIRCNRFFPCLTVSLCHSINSIEKVTPGPLWFPPPSASAPRDLYSPGISHESPLANH